jgi:hypothetical protein
MAAKPSRHHRRGEEGGWRCAITACLQMVSIVSPRCDLFSGMTRVVYRSLIACPCHKCDDIIDNNMFRLNFVRHRGTRTLQTTWRHVCNDDANIFDLSSNLTLQTNSLSATEQDCKPRSQPAVVLPQPRKLFITLSRPTIRRLPTSDPRYFPCNQ